MVCVLAACTPPSPDGDEGGTGEETGDTEGTGGTGECEDSLSLEYEAPGPLAFGALWADEDEVVAAGRREIVTFDGAKWATARVDELEGVNDVWANSADDVYLVGETGIAHWDGAALELQHTTPAVELGDWVESFEAIWGASATEIWAVGLDRQYVIDCYYDCPYRSLAYRGPAAWDEIPLGTKSSLEAIHGADGRVVAGGGFDVSMHDGAAWTQWPAPEIQVSHLWTPDGATTWLASAAERKVAHGGPDGWETLDLAPQAQSSEAGIMGLWGTAADDVYAALGDEVSTRVLHWDADAWEVYADLDANMRVFEPGGRVDRGRRLMATGASLLLAAGGDGAEIWEVEQGTGTRRYASGAVGPLVDLYALEDGTTLGVGTRGLSHGDAGSWTTLVQAPVGEAWSAVVGRSPTDVYLAGWQTRLAHWDGDALTQVPLPLDEGGVEDLWIGADTLWVVTTGFDPDTEKIYSAVLRLDGGGWQIIELDSQAYSPRLVGNTANPWLVAGGKLWRWTAGTFVEIEAAGTRVQDAAVDDDESPWLIADAQVARLVGGELQYAPLPHTWRRIAARGEVWAIGTGAGEGDPLAAARFDGEAWVHATFEPHRLEDAVVATNDGAIVSDESGPVRVRLGCP